MILVAHREYKLSTLRVVSVSSKIQHQLAASDMPFAVIRNDGWLMCGCERPLAAGKSVIRVESDFPNAICGRRSPCANER